MFPSWSPWCSHCHLASALSHCTSCAMLWAPVEKTMHLPHHQLSEALWEGWGLAGAQPNPLANSKPPPTPSPAVGPVPGNSFKLMAPAQGPRTAGFLRSNFIWKAMNPQAMQGKKKNTKSKQTKSLEHLVWLTLEVSGVDSKSRKVEVSSLWPGPLTLFYLYLSQSTQ